MPITGRRGLEHERAQRISRVFHEALHGRRTRARTCGPRTGDDDAFRREGESLLECESADASVLRAPALVASQCPGSLAGRRLGAYVIGERFDGRDMGDICRARDTKLGRDVATKVLPRHFSVGAERRSRCRREAHLLATLGR